MKSCAITLFLFLVCYAGHAQEYLNDYIMKLDEVSTSDKYGYSEKKPIGVGGMFSHSSNNLKYLSALRGPNGEKVQFNRLGSCCSFKTKNALIGNKGLLDKYEVTYKGLLEPVILYINMYDYKDPKCPKGFTFYTTDKLPQIKTVPKDSIKAVAFCTEANKFAVKDHALQDYLGNQFVEPGAYPEFEAGLDSLQAFFAQYPLKDLRAKRIVFRVAIGFVVNCNGEPGNYTILTSGKGDLEELANQVLLVCNNIPSGWKPAVGNDKQVDAYQILWFTVMGGSLDKVTYRVKEQESRSILNNENK